MKKICFLLIAILFECNLLNAQTAGTIDTTFNNNTGSFTLDFGFHENISSVVIQPDQKIVGTATALASGSYLGTLKVIRLNSDGTPDNTFANNGVFSFSVTAETYGVESVVRNDGKIVVAGLAAYTFGYYDILLLRLNSDGTLDTTFGTNGYTIVSHSSRDDLAQSLALQPDGKIIIAGSITDSIDFYHQPTILRFTENGMIDSSFGTNGYVQFPATYIDNELNDLLIQPGGKIVAAGHYDVNGGGSSDFDVVMFRVDTNGIPDSTFGINGKVITAINAGVDDVFGMAQDTAGNIVLCGFTTQPTLNQDLLLLKYTSDGVLIFTFGNNGMAILDFADTDVGMGIKIQPDNKIIVGGSSGQAFFGPRTMAVWRMMPDGTPDPTFGNNGIVLTALSSTFQDINCIDLQSDLKIVAGARANLGANNDIAVVRYFNDALTPVQEISSHQINIYPNPASDFINISLPNGIKDATVELYNATGNKLNSITGKPGKLDVHLPPGIYFVKVICRDLQLTRKLVITNQDSQ